MVGILDVLRSLIDPPHVREPVEPPQATVDSSTPHDVVVKRLGVSGEAQRNPDGSERQRIIRRCKPGDEILIREPLNPYDTFAVALFTRRGQQVGYIKREDAPVVAKRLALLWRDAASGVRSMDTMPNAARLGEHPGHVWWASGPAILKGAKVVLDAGVQPVAFIAKILGGTREKPNFGLVIDIHWPKTRRVTRRQA